jgi:hypothetical protein
MVGGNEFRPSTEARSAAALARMTARTFALPSVAASAARRSHFNDSALSPRCQLASAVESAQETSSRSPGSALGM